MHTIITALLTCSIATCQYTIQPDFETITIHAAPAPAFYPSIGAIPLPEGFQRVALKEGSFGAYLRNFPLRRSDVVKLYDGSNKWNQEVHYAILDIDIGSRDLQQCADVVMHLRAEYLWKKKRYKEISFDFVSGKTAKYAEYANGDYSEARYLKYLTYVYSYANTRSLRKQMTPVTPDQMQVGDVFVQAGNPYGHAMIVVDMAENPATGKKMFLLAQGFIPAQDCELVVNPNSSSGSPWYSTEIGSQLTTPQWRFYPEDLRRFN